MMNFVIAIIIISMSLFMTACSGGRGTSLCATDLKYATNPFTSGEQALRHASEYYANLPIGASNFFVKAVVDTASANLVINEKSYDLGKEAIIGQKSFVYDNGHVKSEAVNAQDAIDIACMANFPTRFSLTSQDYSTPNYLGLAWSAEDKHPHEAKSIPFFDQLVKKEGFEDAFSMALCGVRGNSRLVLGGLDERMIKLVGDFIPIIEKSAYVVPAISLRRADNKKELGEFPHYNPKTKSGIKTIIDSASPFLMLPREMAMAIAFVIEREAEALGLFNRFPNGFFRTERFNSTKIVRFSNYAQIKQFPSLEVIFRGVDGKQKTLELSPLHYFKEMDTVDPMIRTFAIRETSKEVILGQPFLENHFILFDRKNNRIGFGSIDIACAQ